MLVRANSSHVWTSTKHVGSWNMDVVVVDVGGQGLEIPWKHGAFC